MLSILKEFGRGQITLPKKWRERFHTRIYIAKETSQGLLIIPMDDRSIKVDEAKLKHESSVQEVSSFFKRKTISPSK